MNKNTLVAQWIKNWAKNRNYPFISYTKTTSTNDKAKEYCTDEQEHKQILFITELQTKGRGRRNKKWINSDMMISWSYILDKAPQPVTTKLMGIALHTALKSTWKECLFKIKQPNDIYVNNKKMAGILIEATNQGTLHQLIIGAGINVFTNPGDNLFTHLKKHTKEVNEKKWFSFFDKWNTEIKNTIPSCTKIPSSL